VSVDVDQIIEQARCTDPTFVNLHNRELTAVPESLRTLTGVRHLSLDFNQLTELPEWLGELDTLTHLSISANPLGHLPDWLGGLTSLRTLLASHIIQARRLTPAEQCSLPRWTTCGT